MDDLCVIELYLRILPSSTVLNTHTCGRCNWMPVASYYTERTRRNVIVCKRLYYCGNPTFSISVIEYGSIGNIVESVINKHGPQQHTRQPSRKGTWLDLDSYEIGIDNRCSRSVSHESTYFVGQLTNTSDRIKGFCGVIHEQLKRGTIVCK